MTLHGGCHTGCSSTRDPPQGAAGLSVCQRPRKKQIQIKTQIMEFFLAPCFMIIWPPCCCIKFLPNQFDRAITSQHFNLLWGINFGTREVTVAIYLQRALHRSMFRRKFRPMILLVCLNCGKLKSDLPLNMAHHRTLGSAVSSAPNSLKSS